MPYSKVQRRAAAIAEHHPEKLHKRNKSLLGMSPGQLHDFASGSEKDMPMRAEKHKKGKNLLRP